MKFLLFYVLGWRIIDMVFSVAWYGWCHPSVYRAYFHQIVYFCNILLWLQQILFIIEFQYFAVICRRFKRFRRPVGAIWNIWNILIWNIWNIWNTIDEGVHEFCPVTALAVLVIHSWKRESIRIIHHRFQIQNWEIKIQSFLWW